jgi:hypothetical protein
MMSLIDCAAVPDTRPFRAPFVGAAFAAALFALAYGALITGFLNDDFLFLEQARAGHLGQALTHLDALGNYYRPLSRQIYFAVLTSWSHGSPLVFHAVNFALFLAALALLADLLGALLPAAAALAGLLYFAVLPFQRVAWMWISCSQDLMALAFALAAVALYRRSKLVAAAAFSLAAFTSKESALALPAALAAWDLVIARRTPRETARRVMPFAVLALAWAAVALTMGGHGARAVQLHFDPGSFLAAYVHEAQSLLGLDHPAGMWDALARRGPDVAALLLLSAIALAFPGLWHTRSASTRAGAQGRAGAVQARAAPAPSRVSTVPARAVAVFATVWLLAFGLVTGPAASMWSAYFYMTCAVGAAALFGLAARGLGPWSWPVLAGALLWWHAGGSGVRSFATREGAWEWTSHLTGYYFERAAALTDTLSRQLRALEPSPAPGTRLFFATLPSWAGFQMGSGALVRELYRDPTLQSWFYSQYSESTADQRPCRFYYWDGRALRALYPRLSDPSFQVGGDLLLLDRPAGAAHAFRRGLAAGGDRSDLLYWLGWAELWSGRREAAEAAWLELGARDDSLRWETEIVSANHALAARDTLAAQRHLAAANLAGIGRPVAHAVIGELLMDRQPKYALMELSVAAALDPADLRVRRMLAGGLARARLDAAALRHLEALEARDPAWRSDAGLVRLDAALRERTGSPSPEEAAVPMERMR